MIRRILLALTLVASLALVTPTPAAADHEPRATHWSTQGGAFHPAVDCDPRSYIAGTALCTYVGWAQNRWNASSAWGQTQWYGAGVTAYGHQTNWIKVYGVPQSSLPAGFAGLTSTASWPDGHIRSVVIHICGNCGMTQKEVDDTVTHEYGHAIGLFHTNATDWAGNPSYMYYTDCACRFVITNHDIVALGSVYDPRFHNH